MTYHFLLNKILKHFAQIDSVLQKFFEFLGVDQAFCITDSTRHNPGTARFHDRRFTTALRQIPGVARAEEIFPRRLLYRLRPLFRRHIIAETPLWSPSLLEEVTAGLLRNTEVFLERYGKDPHFWTFEPGAVAVRGAEAVGKIEST